MRLLKIGDVLIRDRFEDHARPFVVCSVEFSEPVALGDYENDIDVYEEDLPRITYGLIRAGETAILPLVHKEIEHGEWALRLEDGLASALTLRDLLLADWREMQDRDFAAWADAARDTIIADVQGRDGRMWQVIFGTGYHESDDRTPSFEATSGGQTGLRMEIGDVKFETF